MTPRTRHLLAMLGVVAAAACAMQVTPPPPPPDVSPRPGVVVPACDAPDCIVQISDGLYGRFGGMPLLALRRDGVALTASTGPWRTPDTCPVATTPCPVVMPIVGLDDAVQIATGSDYQCVLRRSGSVRCAGLDDSGTLGAREGNVWLASRGVADAAIDDAVQIALGFGNGCAVRRSGHVACWGASNGLLGRGPDLPATPRVRLPDDVVGLSDAETVTFFNEQLACARRPGDHWVCWGELDSLRGGMSDPIQHRVVATPTPVPELDGLVELSSGWCGRTRDGRVLCWNECRAACGAADDELVWPPRPILGLSGVTALADGPNFALLADGRVVGWGSNYRGALGRGPALSQEYGAWFGPDFVAGLDDARPPIYRRCVGRAVGGIWCWDGGGLHRWTELP